ncbi:MAG: AbrB/MazE/SpoVT family DNA-binding domain-containing protein [Candidatus Hydrothermarchaeaceae archaeon]
MTMVKVSTKGQIVIPIEIRKRHEIVTGMELEILDFGKEIVLIPVKGDPIKSAKGLIKFKRPLLEILSAVRDEEKKFVMTKKG